MSRDGGKFKICFSVVQRKLLTPDDVDDVDDLAERLQAFEQRYNAAATPFDWRFNTDDLNPEPTPAPSQAVTPDELTGATTSVP